MYVYDHILYKCTHTPTDTHTQAMIIMLIKFNDCIAVIQCVIHAKLISILACKSKRTIIIC